MANYKKTSKRSRNSKNFVAMPFNGTVALGTLADQAVVIDDALGGNLTENLYAVSADLMAEVKGLTAGEGEPMVAGFAHGDYVATEIAENLNVVFLGPVDKIVQERTRRLVRKSGVFFGNSDNTQTNMRLIGADGSRIIRTRLRFLLNESKSLSIFIQNLSTGALTTGASLVYSGTLYGRWVF